ncbi:MAG: 2-C-methyl-D-erythritol 4-phosphate cytidylyltransferase [Candidatus Thioglobus sp. MED-G23]|nr:MAG: 2-C-methyl-D-erythritol 4-phosphate cytidylyltransferase [Candidatus Thioglobus sp. MED-G23]
MSQHNQRVKPKIWAIVPAAGSGTRFGSDLPKQYHSLAGEEVILRTLRLLSVVTRVSGITVGVAAHDPVWAGLLPRLPERVSSFEGGQTRSETVLNGLSKLIRQGREADWVLVHDSVRPCVRVQDINRLIDETGFCSPGGLLATPVSDTLKAVSPGHQVTGSVPRESLWRAQTPQLFPVGLLHEGLTKACAENFDCTDDAQALERLGLKPSVISGSSLNLKITRDSDLALAQAILDMQEELPCSE